MSRLNPLWILLAVSVVLIGTAVLLLSNKSPVGKGDPLIVYTAAAIAEPMQEIADLYEQQTGQKIELRFGKSEELVASVKTTKQGDLLIPADDSYLVKAHKDGLIEDILPVARMSAIWVVNPASKREIKTWDDLFAVPDDKLAMASEGAAIRNLAEKKLPPEQWKQIAEHSVSLGTVTDVANAVKLGTHVNVGLIWDNMLASPNYKHLTGVRLKETDRIVGSVKVGIIKFTTRIQAAQAFARFVSGSCGDIFKKHGFSDATGSISPPPQVKKSNPELLIYAGSMLRPAIEETIREFEKREGVTVRTVYNGCGILVAQMQAGERPDAYFSCDPTFMNQVSDLFETPKIISKNQLVIAVPKGNPYKIASLKDLGQPGMKIGVGHEQQCALGAITQGVLIRTKTLKAITENVAVRSPSGDLLVNQLRTGSLDAVVAYVSNVKPYSDELEAITVEEVNCAPTQPLAPSKTTQHPELVQRLIKAIESAESKARFEKFGFGWELAP